MTKEKFWLAKNVRDYKHLDKKQYQVCLGGLLGDSNINVRDNGRCRIKFCHAEKQLEYLEWKRNIMGEFIVAEKPTIEIIKEGKSFGKVGSKFYIYNTIGHQDFTDMYGLMYRTKLGKRKKYITRKVLNELNNFGLLIWYIDDGCITKDKEARIASNDLTLSEHKSLRIWFWQKYRITALISYNKTADCYFLRFNVANTKKLFDLFKEFKDDIPECVKHKFKRVWY